jgi:hypothetical protein
LIEVTDPESPIYGVKVEVPEGSLSENKTITVSRAEEPTEAIDSFHIVGECVNLGPDGLTFLNAVTITLPYNDNDNDGIVDGTTFSEENIETKYYDEVKKQWRYLPNINRDLVNNFIVSKSYHFSTVGNVIDSSLVPKVRRFWDIDGVKDGIEDEEDNGFFPITIQRLAAGALRWKVLFAPKVIHEKGAPEFKFRCQVGINSTSYWDYYNEYKNSDFKEIFLQEYIYGFEEYHNTIWVKNAGKIHDMDKAKVLELPYSFTYYNVEDAVLVELLNAGMEHLAIEIVKKMTSYPIPYLNAVLTLKSIASISHDIVSNTNRPIAGLFPVHSDNINTIDITHEREDIKISRCKLNRNIEKISAEVYLDFIKWGLRTNGPWDVLKGGLYIQPLWTHWNPDQCSDNSPSNACYPDPGDPPLGFCSNFKPLLTEAELRMLPRGRFFVVMPKMNIDEPVLLTVPDPEHGFRNVSSDCFYLQAKAYEGWENIHPFYSKIKFDEGGDTTPPTVVSHTCAFTPYQTTVVTFSEDMDPNSINNNTITVCCYGYCDQPEPGNITYDPSNRTATWTYPGGHNSPSCGDWTIRVDTGVKDISGNHMETEYNGGC